MIVSMPRFEPVNFLISSRRSIHWTVTSDKINPMINIALLQGSVTKEIILFLLHA